MAEKKEPVVLTASNVAVGVNSVVAADEPNEPEVTANTKYKVKNISNAVMYMESGIIKPGEDGVVTQAELSCLHMCFEKL